MTDFSVSLPASATPVHASAGTGLNTRFLYALFFLLTGYATANKGFAYIGVAPFFIGDITMVFGLVTFLMAGQWKAVLTDRCLLCVAAFMAWGAARTFPLIGQYGFDALRDAVLWAYGLYAILVASSLLSDQSHPALFLRFFQVFAVIFICAFPFMFGLTEIFGAYLPLWPGTDVTIIELKVPHALVHMAGVTSLLLSGLISLSGTLRLALTAFVLICAARARSGFMAFLAAVTLVGALAPVRKYLMIGALVLVGAFGVLWATEAHIKLTDDRELSAEAITHGIATLTVGFDVSGYHDARKMIQRAGRLDATVIWRAAWTLFLVDRVSREALWTGLGFGMSLALPGLPIAVGEDVRSPHNGFTTVFARMGLIGFGLWILMLGVWMQAMLSCHFRAVRKGHFVWASIFMAVPAYLIAILVNSAFDVMLEGPMGGIWFWSLIGLGAGMRRWYARSPEMFTPAGTVQ